MVLYSKVDSDLPAINGNGQWVLPISATLVFDAYGKVMYKHVEFDFLLRAEPMAVIRAPLNK